MLKNKQTKGCISRKEVGRFETIPDNQIFPRVVCFPNEDPLLEYSRLK